jgi:hypothetical protein
MTTVLKLRPDQLPENLLTKSEFEEVRSLFKCLRSKDDPPPTLIPPPIVYCGAEAHSSALNVCKYIKEQPHRGLSAVKGFKIWRIGKMNWITACFHCVIRTPAGAYIDVTPEEMGDEGKPMIFVPSSRVYRQYSVEVIAHMTESGLEPRTGLVACPERWYNIKAYCDVDLDSRILSPTADNLSLWLAPHVSNIPTGISFGDLVEKGARVYTDAPDRFVISADGFVQACKKTLGHFNEVQLSNS